jgi:putative redox protein
VTERRVSARWKPGPLRCDVEVDSGHSIVADEPEHAGGTGQGPQPTDLLLSSVASCFTLALVYSAKKHDVTLTEVTVEVIGTYDGPRFRAIDIAAHLGGVDGAIRDRLVASAERVCYVTNTLRKPPEITVTVD